MMLVGLTGGIASGKSTVSKRFEAAGCPVVDADVVAREVVAPGSPGLKAVVEAFGEGILTSEGELDRPALGALVFGDEAARERINGILHPRIQGVMAQRLMALGSEGHPIIVMDIPLLYEGRNPEDFDAVVVVWVDKGTQLKRLMARDGAEEGAALARIRSQMSLDDKKARADYVIDNTGTPEETARQVDGLLATLRARAD